MQLNRILVAVNSPSARDAAFARALAVARRSGAELSVLYAVPRNQRFSFHAAERLERMADMRRRAEDAGVRVHTIEQHGDPAALIALHATARDADLVVIGSEARRGWGRAWSGVAEKVIRRSAVPILVVASDGAEHPTEFRNVLVAVDLTPGAIDVVAGAIGLAAPELQQLTVMHTVTGVEAADAVQSLARWKVPEFRTHILNDARQSLHALVSDIPAAVTTRVEVSAGSASRTIRDRASDISADLVVVGRSRGFKLLGSTARRLLRSNERALLVIPGADARARRSEGRRAA